MGGEENQDVQGSLHACDDKNSVNRCLLIREYENDSRVPVPVPDVPGRGLSPADTVALHPLPESSSCPQVSGLHVKTTTADGFNITQSSFHRPMATKMFLMADTGLEPEQPLAPKFRHEQLPHQNHVTDLPTFDWLIIFHKRRGWGCCFEPSSLSMAMWRSPIPTVFFTFFFLRRWRWETLSKTLPMVRRGQLLMI